MEKDDYSLREHFWLFTYDGSKLHEEWKRMMIFIGNRDKSYQRLKEHKPMFQTKKEFLESIVQKK